MNKNSVPGLISSSDGKGYINPSFINFHEKTKIEPYKGIIEIGGEEFSRKRGIEYIWESANSSVFTGILTLTKEELLQKVNHAFGSTKDKFQLIDRNAGGRYFDHQIAVYYLYLELSDNPSILGCNASLEHDSKEDTDISFGTLKDTFSVDLAMCVQLISKPPFKDFIDINDTSIKGISKSENDVINNGKDFENFTPYEKLKIKEILLKNSDYQLKQIISFAGYPDSGILNSKGLLSDEYLSRVKYYKRLNEGKEEFLGDDTPIKISHDEKIAVGLYLILSKRYNNQKNEAFFSHMVENNDLMNRNGFDNEIKIEGNSRFKNNNYSSKDFPCIFSFYNTARKFKDDYNKEYTNIDKHIKMSNERLWRCTFISLEVKFIDRIHNLKTEEVYSKFSPDNIKKARRKIEETKKYFYGIAKEFDEIKGTQYFKLIEKEIKFLENYIMEEDESQRFRLICEGYKRTTKRILEKNNIAGYETFNSWQNRQIKD